MAAFNCSLSAGRTLPFGRKACNKKSNNNNTHHVQGDEHINSAANTTAVRAARIADYLSQALPGTTVLILGLLPRGDVTLHPDPAAFALPSK